MAPGSFCQTEYDSLPRNWPQGYINYYPHSLYLYILYTIGIVGFLAYTNLAVNYWRRLSRTRRLGRNYQGIGKGLPTLGMIVFVLFMIDQFKIEFLRPYLLDYQHYIAAIFGMFASLEKLGNEAS